MLRMEHKYTRKIPERHLSGASEKEWPWALEYHGSANQAHQDTREDAPIRQKRGDGNQRGRNRAGKAGGRGRADLAEFLIILGHFRKVICR